MMWTALLHHILPTIMIEGHLSNQEARINNSSHWVVFPRSSIQYHQVPLIIPLDWLCLVTQWHFSHHSHFLTCRMQPPTITSFLCSFNVIDVMAFEIQQSHCHQILPGDRQFSATITRRTFFFPMVFCWRFKLVKPQTTPAPNLCFCQALGIAPTFGVLVIYYSFDHQHITNELSQECKRWMVSLH